MRNIIIISYFFPPCNLTASQRVFSWAKYLHKFGIYPTIITRRWDHEINTLSDVSKATPEVLLHEINDTYEVYYLPYKANLRDKIYVNSNFKLKFLRRILTFFEVFFQLWTNRIIPFKNLYDFSHDLISKNPNKFDLLVISGNPFIQFKFGFLLHRKFKIKWIADYRDAWTTSEINFINKNKVFSVLNLLERYFEKKWVSSASLITASSGGIADGIGNLVKVNSFPLYNGFDHEELEKVSIDEKYEIFTITYVGTLYDGQRIELFCEAFKELIDKNYTDKIQLLFPGLSFYETQENRIKKILSGYERYYSCTPRINRKQILEIEKKSHVLLHVAWDQHKGIIASKIYEYIGSGTPILVCPSDNGEIESIVKAANVGVCLNNKDEIINFIREKYEQSKNPKEEISNSNSFDFSRLIQVEKLSDLILKEVNHELD
jgi:hypothetical protein